jgi:DNA oxidative demethylase
VQSTQSLDLLDTRPSQEKLADGAYLLRGFALEIAPSLLAEIKRIEVAAPFRHLETPGGFRMSVAMTFFVLLGRSGVLPSPSTAS